MVDPALGLYHFFLLLVHDVCQLHCHLQCQQIKGIIQKPCFMTGSTLVKQEITYLASKIYNKQFTDLFVVTTSKSVELQCPLPKLQGFKCHTVELCMIQPEHRRHTPELHNI